MGNPTWIRAERARVRLEAYVVALDLFSRLPFREAYERLEQRADDTKASLDLMKRDLEKARG